MQKLEGGISGNKNKRLSMEEVNINSSDWLELVVIIAWIIWKHGMICKGQKKKIFLSH